MKIIFKPPCRLNLDTSQYLNYFSGSERELQRCTRVVPCLPADVDEISRIPQRSLQLICIITIAIIIIIVIIIIRVQAIV